MSLSLGIHTAGPFCGVALLEGDTLLAFREEKMRRGHDQFLPGLVQSVLDETGIAMGAIDRFSVCVGPGSFTGIRIGVAFARGLALANGKQAFGITSLEALLSKPQDGPVLALIPAKLRPPDQTFWAQRLQGTERSEPFELSANDLTEYVGTDISLVCTPDAVDIIRNFLPDQSLDVREITAAGVPRWAKLIHADDIRAPSPLYVRDPDAIPAKSPLL